MQFELIAVSGKLTQYFGPIIFLRISSTYLGFGNFADMGMKSQPYVLVISKVMNLYIVVFIRNFLDKNYFFR